MSSPNDYATQLAQKLAVFRADFAPFDLPEPQVFESTPQHYRMRAEFRESREKAYRQRKAFGLVEHEYDEAVPDEVWRAN